MTAMMGVYALGQDLKSLINNPKYSDLEILCGSERKKLYGCRAILAARSVVLDKLLYNGMKETYEKQIFFPHINSAGMEVILEYVYTGFIQENSLTKDNTVEAFYAADYFQLSKLQDFILKSLKNSLERDYMRNYLPELLSKVVEIAPLSEYNVLLNPLVEMVAIIPLNIINFGRLSVNALRYLLSCILKDEIPFATQEYDVFRYCAILSAMQVSNDAYKTLIERLPTFEQLGNSNKVECKLVEFQEVAKELEPLIKFIDFKQIHIKIFADFIEPLRIIPSEIVESIYRHKALLTDLEPEIQARPHKTDKFNYIMDESCGSKLVMEEGKITRVPSEDLACHHEIKGIFEWDVIVENSCTYAWIGLSPPGNYNYERYAGIRDYSKISIHLDMNKRACTFTVNGTKFPEVSGWNNLPAKLYPVVSLCPTGRLIIRSQQKN